MLRATVAVRRALQAPPATSAAAPAALPSSRFTHHAAAGSGRRSHVQRAGHSNSTLATSFSGAHGSAPRLLSSAGLGLACPSHLFQRRGFVSQSASGSPPDAGNEPSGQGSNDQSGKRGDELVGVTATNKSVEADFLPMGQLPHSPSLLLLPVIRPVMPGLSFDIDLRLYPAATRAALDAAIATGQPYVTLVLLQPTERAAVVAKAEQQLTKKERQAEGFEKREVQEGGRSRNRDVDALLERMALTSVYGNQRLPIFPLIRDLSQVYTVGVAAEVKITGPRVDAPRLTGMVHRRVVLLGPVEPAAGTSAVVPPIPKAFAIEAESELAEEKAAGEATKATDATPTSDGAASTPSIPDSSESTLPPVVAAAGAAAAVAAPLHIEVPLPPSEAMRVRVKHLEESRSASAAVVAGDPSVSALDPAAVAERELEEKAYVKAINQTITLLSQDEPVTQRLKAIANSVRSLTTVVVSPGRMADLAAHIAAATEIDLQQVLETTDVQKRLQAVLWLWKKESEDLRIQKEIQTKVREKYEKTVLKHSLKEERKAVDELIQSQQARKFQQEQERAKKEGTAAPVNPALKGNGKEALRAKFSSRINAESGRVVPEPVRRVIDEELAKLANMEPEASEYQVTRNYVDWLTSVPWGVYTPEKFDLDLAEQVLNADHFGLEEVKQRIYEFVASGVLLQQVPPGKILCLVGPPGVGKTSIGKSIARALERQFYRISVGGMDDVSEIKGHRRTYVGSMPGKLIQSLKRTNSCNPVILIDEIDKLGRGGHRGDPASALLEVLDPEQNNAFMDHYLDVPVDLSKVLFICTANDRSQIPGPLADRMDFLTISGYVLQEKLHIAQNHLIPQVALKTGVSSSALTLTEEALAHLIRWYCREAGVRGLQKQLEKIFRKVALKIARANPEAEAEAPATTATTTTAAVKEAEIVGTEATAAATAEPAVALPMASASSLPLPIVITASNLSEYVGKPLHTSDRMYDANPIGVATGLGTNSMGGWLLYTECTLADQNTRVPEHSIVVASDSPEDRRKKDRNNAQGLGMGSLFCTGQLGDVIKESSSIAYTVAKRLLAKHTHPASKYRNFFNRHRVHLHLPEGATPKDGPSAGIAMVTGLLSLALNTPPIVGHAMTGELTLTGLVLPIGGVKEKLMAAKHAGITLVILPAENQKDVLELKPYVVDGLHIHYATNVDQVFELIFPHFVDDVPALAGPAEVPVATIASEADAAATSNKKPRTKRAASTPKAQRLPPSINPAPTTQQPTAE